MKFSDLVAVSGLSGLYKIIANKNNGLLIQDLDSKKIKFASARKHQFTPLAGVSIYTNLDTIAMNDVINNMHKLNKDGTPPPSIKQPKEEIKSYFAKAVPDYNQDQVHTSDMIKVIKFYNFLDQRNIIENLEEPTLKDEQ